jgi:AcrR family transcriptional regulator
VSNRAELTRQKLLEAGRQVAVEMGAASLTVEAVAKAGGVSKGAVLYHFPSKDLLLAAVLESLFDGFDAAVEAQAADGKGWLRAYLRASFPQDRVGYLQETNAIFAIISLRPELRMVARERFLRWHRRAQEDGLDPVTAGLIRSAIDGLWYNEMFGFALDDQQRNALLARLEELAEVSSDGVTLPTPAPRSRR